MNKHAVDGVSLAFGLVFLSFVAWWLLFQLVRVDLPAVGWFVGAAMVVFGVVGLVGILRPRQPNTK